MLNKKHKQIIQLKQTNLVFDGIAWFTFALHVRYHARYEYHDSLIPH